MWKLVESIFNSFLLLRDILGYLMPGAIFLGLAAMGQPKLRGEISRIEASSVAPSWFVVVIVVGFCYVAGQVLVSLGFTAYTLFDKIFRRHPQTAEDADLIFYRYVYPSILVERDRRDIINIMRVGLGVGITIAAVAFPLSEYHPFDEGFPVLRVAMLVVGLFALLNGYTGRNHVFGYGVSTVKAAQRAEQNDVPYFRWNEHSEKGGSDFDKKSNSDKPERP